MSIKHQIILSFVKDLSVETPNAESLIFARENISKYSLKLDLNSKALKNKLIEVETKLTYEDKNKNSGDHQHGAVRLEKTWPQPLIFDTVFSKKLTNRNIDFCRLVDPKADWPRGTPSTRAVSVLRRHFFLAHQTRDFAISHLDIPQIAITPEIRILFCSSIDFQETLLLSIGCRLLLD